MGELKLKVSDEIERKFREFALKKYGYKKGALSMAAGKIIAESIKSETAGKKDLFLNSIGGWKDVNTDALIKRIYESRSAPTRKKVEF